MSKKSFERYKKRKARQADPAKAEKKSGENEVFWDRLLFVVKNLIGALVIGGVLLLLATKVSGYKWLFQNLVANNLGVIVDHSSLSTKEKTIGKLKFAAKYMLFVKKKVPESAVVLFPFDSSHLDTPPDLKHVKKPKDNVMEKAFATYFLYPRKVVYAYEKDDPLYSKVTHVAILDGMGYQYLNYGDRPPRKEGEHGKYTILPINREDR